MLSFILTFPALRDDTADVTAGVENLLQYAITLESFPPSFDIQGVQIFDLDVAAVRHHPGARKNTWFR